MDETMSGPKTNALVEGAPLVAESARTGRVPSPSESGTEEIFCKICYSFENPLGSEEDLISPCGCKGTIKYVHRHCLKIWRFKGKLIKDVKVCEQCFCEYQVDDEKKVSSSIVAVATVSIILSLLLATNLFVSSTADTLFFIANDISAVFSGGRIESLSFGAPVIVCNMASIVAERRQHSAPGSRYVIKKLTDCRGVDHFASVEKKDVYTLKNIHILGSQESGWFTTVTLLGLFYVLIFEQTTALLVNFMLVIWRVLSFGTAMDWALYAILTSYVYFRMFTALRQCMDIYCMYAINAY
ncbi:hypothetical protein NEDG_00210 [Nematocida displodere]|uniref:RING-CH-type domain-containing protein n=1 Tax=Nematocida displodere TaxID=1805483 RepID=A0A177EIF2_9MICR|nr:hypothetical protein NEDG_00210 [Nematocida displodere]